MATATERTERMDLAATNPGGNGRPAKGDRGDKTAVRRTGLASVFTAVHKKGQGFWTRLGTGAAAFGLILLSANFAYRQLVGPLRNQPVVLWLIVGGIIAIGAAVAWYFMNRPTSADFLIATDSEMKKVNWTTQQELIGSTKVVILFMFAIAALLFVTDIVFGYLFYFIDVLRSTPL